MSLLNDYLKKKEGNLELNTGGTRLIDKYITPAQKPTAPIEPVKTTSFFDKAKAKVKSIAGSVIKGVGQFVARTGVAGSQLAAETVDFSADFLASTLESKLKGQIAPGIGKGVQQPVVTDIANKWRTFYDSNVGSQTEKLKSFTDSLSQLEYIKPSDEWSKASLQDKFTKRLPETVFNIGPGIVASLGSYALNPVLGFTVSSGSTANQVSTIAQESGVPKQKAELIGLGTGLLVGFLDKVVPDEILNPQEKKMLIGELSKKIAVSGLKETGTEIAQEGIQILVEATLKKDLNFDEAKTRVIMAGFGGFLGGSSMRAMVGFVNNIRSGDIGDVKPEEIKKEPKIDLGEVKAPEVITEKPTEITTLGEDTTVYRGAKDQTIDVTRKQGITDGVSFSLDETVAKRFADKVGGTVESQTVSKDAKVVNLSFLENLTEDLPAKDKNVVATKYLKDNEIDVVRVDLKEGQKGEAELVVVNDRVLIKPKENKIDQDLVKEVGKYKSAEDFVKNNISRDAVFRDYYKMDSEDIGMSSDKTKTDLLTEFYDKFSKEAEIPKTTRVFIKGKISKKGAYTDVPIIRRENNITLYQGGNNEGRQFWTPDKKYAKQFGKVTEKTGDFYKVDNGNRVTDVYVEVQSAKEVKPKLTAQTTPLSPTKRGVSTQAQNTTPPPPKAIKVADIKPPKRGVFTVNNRKQIQQEIADIIVKSTDQDVAVNEIENFVIDQINDFENPVYEQKLKAIRAEMKRKMYDIVGVGTGNWKTDYAYFQTSRTNPEVNKIVDKLEDSVLQIDEIVNKDAPSSSLGYASTGSVNINEFEQRSTPKNGTEEFKMYEKVKALTQKYAATIGEGYTPRRALGVFYPKTKNIRVNAINNLSVASHEITHFLDEKFKISSKLMAVSGYSDDGKPIYNIMTKKYRKQLTDLYVKYYPGGKKGHSLRTRTLEGFATLLQKYVESPKAISAEYPLLVSGFLKEGGHYYQPVMGEIIKDLNAIVEEYQGLKSLDKIGSKVTSDQINVDKESFLGLGDKIRQFLADEIYPVEVLAKRSETYMTSEDPSLWLRAYNSISGLVNNNISTDRGYWTVSGDGIKKTHDFNWKTLVDMTRKTKSTDEFGYYLVARREHYAYIELDELKAKLDQETKALNEMPRDERDTKDENGMTPADRVKQAEDAYNSLYSVLKNDGISREDATLAFNENKDRFAEETKMFDILTKADLELMNSEDVQLITPQQFKELSSQQGYASFKRQFYDDIVGDNNDITGTARVGKTKVSSLIRRKGSERTIINPLFNGITNHSEVLRKSVKQIVYNKMTKIGVSAMFPNLFQEVELKVSVDKQTGAVTYPQEKDSNIIMGREGYKRKPILVDGQLKSVIDKVLTYDNVDVFMKLYTGLSRMFTAGTTGFYPQFAATNFLRDQITAQVNTENKFKSLYSPLKTFGTMISKKDAKAYEFYQEYLIMGGERQTFTGWQKLPPKDLFRVIAKERKALEWVSTALEKSTDVLSIPAKYSELVTRASEYINARKSGKTPIVALEQAGRLTAPFHHLGSWGGKFGQTFIRGLPFFNASLQVLDQHARVAGTAQGRKRLAFVILALTASYLVAITKILKATDEQKDQYKDLTPEELSQFLYFPHPSGKKMIRVPVANTFTQIGTIMNMVIADRLLNTKYKPSDYLQAATAWLPDQFNITEPMKAFLSWIPQIFKTGVEAAVGVKTYPRVSPLESQALKLLPPGLRTTENTSKFAKWLGAKTNLSPIKIDFLITGYLGRSAGFLTGQPSAFQFDSSIVRDYWFSGGRRVNGMYELKTSNEEKYNAYQKHKVDLSPDEVNEVYRVYVLSSAFADVMNDYRDVDIEKEQEKAAKLRNEALNIMKMIENGDKPTSKQLPKTYSSFSDWVSKAKERRKKNE